MRKGYSLPEQQRACLAKAQSLGATEILEFSDDLTGDVLDRPGLNAARETVRRGGVRWFITYDLDRLSRQLVDNLIVDQELQRAGVDLTFCTHDYERTPDGQLYLAMKGAFAQFDKARILERTSRGKRGKMRQGGLPAFVNTYGYDFVVGQGALVENQAEATWVRRMFDWVTEDQMSIRGIVEQLNDLAVPAPRGQWWYRSTVKRILKNAVYTGTLFLNRYDTTKETRAKTVNRDGPLVQLRDPAEWIAVAVPAIISAAQFDAAQQVMARASHRRERQDGSSRLLSGMLICGLCKNTIRYKCASRWASYLACSRRFEYRDLSPAKQVPCSLSYVKASLVEEFVCATVKSWVFDPQKLRDVLQERKRGAGDDLEAAELAQVAGQIDATDKERRNLTTLYRKDLVDHAEAERDLEELRRRLERLKARKDELEHLIGRANSVDPDEKVEALEETMAQLRQVWDSLAVEDLQHAVRLLVDKVVISGKDPSQWKVIALG